MSFTVEHTYRFDAQGKLDADDWLLVPRARLRHDFELDAALADEMARRYFELVGQQGAFQLRVVRDINSVSYRAPLGKTAMLFAEPERVVDAQRAETSWRIAGGFLLAHHVQYGGRFYLGGEWDAADALKLYCAIRRYPPRLLDYFGVKRGAQIYERSQGFVHKRTSARFLQEIAARICRP